jgi:uncharacterized protein (TIGR00369 family)
MTLIDVCGGLAATRALGSVRCFTSDLTTHFLNGGKVGPVRAEANVLRCGRSSAVVEVRVIDVGADDRLMAVAMMTMTKPTKPG